MKVMSRFGRPSPAMVVALLALFLAMGGTTYAVKRVGTRQLANKAVTSAKIRNNAVTGRKIKNGSIDSSKVKADSLTGANINEGTLTTVPSANVANSVARLDYNTATVTNPPTTTPLPGALSVSCDPGLRATGGGVKLDESGLQSTYDDNPRGNDGWEARVFNTDVVAHTYTIYVICTSAAGVS
jgi:hypothetical protein